MARAKKTTPISDRLLVIACGMIAREVLAVKERNGLDHLDLICLPAEFHYRPNRIAPAMDKAIAEARDKGYRHIFAGYADCGTGGRSTACSKSMASSASPVRIASPSTRAMRHSRRSARTT